jgi:uncharacterized tellurite resistance protein B-like protein
MYNQSVTTPSQALCHLYFHCSFKDGTLSSPEADAMADRFVALGIQKELHFKEEMKAYQAYKKNIIDEWLYLEYLIKLISPVNTLALYSWCVELVVSDEQFDHTEEDLLKKIASLLEIDEPQQQVIFKLMLERKVVETQKIV